MRLVAMVTKAVSMSEALRALRIRRCIPKARAEPSASLSHARVVLVGWILEDGHSGNLGYSLPEKLQLLSYQVDRHAAQPREISAGPG